MKKLRIVFIIIIVILVAGFYNTAYGQNAPTQCITVED
jgi:hypothetical protein